MALALLLSGCGKSESGPEPSAQAPTVASTSPERTATTSPSTPETAPSTPRTTPQAQPGTGPAGSEAPAGVAPAHPVPAAFRPAPGAPSDQQVREELETMRALQRAEYRRSLSAASANLAGLLPWTLEPKSGTQISVASEFTDYGLGLACGGLLGRHQLGVAHKTAPCGTLITFTYNGRSLTVPVIDRGPYIAGREWDLTGATAEALHFPGLARIEWSVAG
jgi:rare lipoprotein A (peptidoglycan hydrolase)